jgi:hypothetical protein
MGLDKDQQALYSILGAATFHQARALLFLLYSQDH